MGVAARLGGLPGHRRVPWHLPAQWPARRAGILAAGRGRPGVRARAADAQRAHLDLVRAAADGCIALGGEPARRRCARRIASTRRGPVGGGAAVRGRRQRGGDAGGPSRPGPVVADARAWSTAACAHELVGARRGAGLRVVADPVAASGQVQPAVPRLDRGELDHHAADVAARRPARRRSLGVLSRPEHLACRVDLRVRAGVDRRDRGGSGRGPGRPRRSTDSAPTVSVGDATAGSRPRHGRPRGGGRPAGRVDGALAARWPARRIPQRAQVRSAHPAATRDRRRAFTRGHEAAAPRVAARLSGAGAVARPAARSGSCGGDRPGRRVASADESSRVVPACHDRTGMVARRRLVARAEQSRRPRPGGSRLRVAGIPVGRDSRQRAAAGSDDAVDDARLGAADAGRLHPAARRHRADHVQRCIPS